MTDSTSHHTEAPEVFMVLDAVNVDLVAAFWAEALGYRRADHIDQYEVLAPLAGNPGSILLVQGVPESKTIKNRMHLDLHVADPDAEADRLVALGATRTGAGSLGEIAWINMRDPEGNEFDIGRRSG